MRSQTAAPTPIHPPNFPSCPPWIEHAVGRGLFRLAILSLDGTPARDVIAGTAEVWVRCITRGKSWSETHDAPRFEEAFDVLCSTCRHWPAPADFLQALPARPSERREPVRRIESAASKARVQKIITGVTEHLCRSALREVCPPHALLASTQVKRP